MNKYRKIVKNYTIGKHYKIDFSICATINAFLISFFNIKILILTLYLKKYTF